MPLNHLLNYFLHLAPSAMIARIYEDLMPRSGLRAPVMRVRDDWKDVPFCQPDVWMNDATTNAFIELKLGSQLSYPQIFRYAGLAAKAGPTLDASLLLLGPTDRFRQADVFEHRRTEGGLVIPDELLSKIVAAGLVPEVVLGCAQRMQIKKATFADLIAALDRQVDRLGDDEGAETLGKLLRGLRDAFARVK